MRAKVSGVVLASLVLLGASAREPAIEQRDDSLRQQASHDEEAHFTLWLKGAEYGLTLAHCLQTDSFIAQHLRREIYEPVFRTSFRLGIETCRDLRSVLAQHMEIF